MNVNDMIKKNNVLRRQLNEQNLKVYEDILVYIRASRLSEYETESLLLETLDHLCEAQKDGKTAEDVFGSDITAYCDELIENMPKEKFTVSILDFFQYGFLVLGWIFIVHTIFQVLALVNPKFGEQEVSVIPYLSAFVLTFLAVMATLSALKKSVKGPNSPFIVAAGLWLANIALFIVLNIWAKEVWTIPMNVWISGIIMIAAFALASAFKQLSRWLTRPK